MFGSHKYRSWLRHPGCNKKDSEAPDYGPMAEASKESARIMADLGREQLDFARQQYDDLKPMYDDLTKQQMSIADETAAQGRDYYEYQKSFRDVEQQMLDDAMVGRDAEIADFDAANKADAGLMTMDDASLYNARRAEIDPSVGQAVADAQGGYTRSLNQAIRQGLRYGASTPNIVGQVGSIGLSQAQNVASAANNARRTGVQDVRSRVGQGMQLRSTNLNAKNQQQAVDWAKKLDAAGLVKGMPGASAGAYGLAINAGNSAGTNAGKPGDQLMSGLGQGASTIGSGRTMYQSGLGSVLDSKTSVYNNSQSNNAEMLGTAMGIGTKAAFSDRRLKENIVAVGVDERTGLTLYEFNYINDDRRFVGVMADEVEEIMPEAVQSDARGYRMVNYVMLGIEMKEV